MRMNDMTPELFLSVLCPTCKVASGNRCLSYSGGLRTESHIDRKLAAIEAVETRRIHLIKVRSTLKKLTPLADERLKPVVR